MFTSTKVFGNFFQNAERHAMAHPGHAVVGGLCKAFYLPDDFRAAPFTLLSVATERQGA
jgi:hypothetical protein